MKGFFDNWRESNIKKALLAHVASWILVISARNAGAEPGLLVWGFWPLYASTLAVICFGVEALSLRYDWVWRLNGLNNIPAQIPGMLLGLYGAILTSFVYGRVWLWVLVAWPALELIDRLVEYRSEAITFIRKHLFAIAMIWVAAASVALASLVSPWFIAGLLISICVPLVLWGFGLEDKLAKLRSEHSEELEKLRAQRAESERFAKEYLDQTVKGARALAESRDEFQRKYDETKYQLCLVLSYFIGRCNLMGETKQVSKALVGYWRGEQFRALIKFAVGSDNFDLIFKEARPKAIASAAKKVVQDGHALGEALTDEQQAALSLFVMKNEQVEQPAS